MARPIEILRMAGSAGPAGVNWANIAAAGTGTITGSNSDQTMIAAGTLSFSVAGFGGTVTVYKNSIAQGSLAPLSVAIGDKVHFSATSNPGPGIIDSGSLTVSGVASDVISITIRDTGTP